MNYKLIVPEKGSYNEDKHTVEWILNSGEMDRDGEIIEAEGWLDNGSAVPLIWAHRSSYADVTDILGTVEETWVAGKKYMGRTRFSQGHDMAKVAETMVAEGVLRNGSVGFRPFRWINHDGTKGQREEGDAFPYPQRGRRYTKQELVEFSIVPVPSDRRAQVKAVDDPELRRWITEIVRSIVRDEMEVKRIEQSALEFFSTR